jgi:trehalose 6-phosphate synthase/phosphatase
MTDASSREEELLERITNMYAQLAEVREKQEEEERSTSLIGDNSRRVILVSRRLPFTLQRSSEGWKPVELRGSQMDEVQRAYSFLHKGVTCIWIGWPGADVDTGEAFAVRDRLLQEKRYLPVFLDPKREQLFYKGYCKKILWPLFHSLPPSIDEMMNQALEGEEEDYSAMWDAYQSVNQQFADAVQNVYEEGDMVWVQDYHLCVLPQMLRNFNANMSIGFFLHLPFPTSEIYRILWHRQEILVGMLGADLIGFQAYDYARHFRSACIRILGADTYLSSIEVNGSPTVLTVLPMGIDPNYFARVATSDAARQQAQSIKKQFEGKTILLGVDRLDQVQSCGGGVQCM